MACRLGRVFVSVWIYHAASPRFSFRLCCNVRCNACPVDARSVSSNSNGLTSDSPLPVLIHVGGKQDCLRSESRWRDANVAMLLGNRIQADLVTPSMT